MRRDQRSFFFVPLPLPERELPLPVAPLAALPALLEPLLFLSLPGAFAPSFPVLPFVAMLLGFLIGSSYRVKPWSAPRSTSNRLSPFRSCSLLASELVNKWGPCFTISYCAAFRFVRMAWVARYVPICTLTAKCVPDRSTVRAHPGHGSGGVPGIGPGFVPTPFMHTIRYHIKNKYDGTWLAMREGTHCPSVRAATLQEAERRTLEIARRWNATVTVHLPDGSTRVL